MEGDVNTLSPNTRIGQIKRMLSKPPKGAAELLLTASAAGGGTVVCLATWPVNEATPVLALEIMAMLEEHAESLSSRVVGMAIWRDEKEKQLSTKVINASPPPSDNPGDSLASSPDQLTGDATSLTIQAQKHLEVMQRMMLTSLGGVLQQSRQLADHAMELCEALATAKAEAEGKVVRLEQEKEALQEERDAIYANADDQGDQQVNASQAQMMRYLEPVLQMAIAKYMAGGGPATPPPAAS